MSNISCVKKDTFRSLVKAPIINIIGGIYMRNTYAWIGIVFILTGCEAPVTGTAKLANVNQGNPDPTPSITPGPDLKQEPCNQAHMVSNGFDQNHPTGIHYRCSDQATGARGLKISFYDDETVIRQESGLPQQTLSLTTQWDYNGPYEGLYCYYNLRLGSASGPVYYDNFNMTLDGSNYVLQFQEHNVIRNASDALWNCHIENDAVPFP